MGFFLQYRLFYFLYAKLIETFRTNKVLKKNKKFESNFQVFKASKNKKKKNYVIKKKDLYQVLVKSETQELNDFKDLMAKKIIREPSKMQINIHLVFFSNSKVKIKQQQQQY